MRTGHRRQLILFLLAIVVPFLVLVALSVRLLVEDRELRADQGGAQRRTRATAVAKRILAQLEDIRRDELRTRLEPGQRYRHPETAFVGWLEERRLVLPWESDGTARTPVADPAFQEQLRPCEQAEFAGRRSDNAAACYQRVAQSTTNPAQSIYARLLRSRVLDRAGHTDAAVEQLRALLDTDASLVDEDGVPIRFYAAQRLSQLGLATDRVIARTREALSARPWLPPLACFVATDIADRAHSDELHRLAAAHVRLSEQAQALQGDLARAGLRNDWVAYGDDLWLIGLAEPANPRSAVLVIHAARLLRPLTAEGFRFTGDRDPAAEPLGSALAGLRVVLPPEDPRLLERARGLQRSLLYFALCLLGAATAFGAWLLWRDLQRSVRLADLRGQFVSSVSHELKTPLTAIRMLAETLQMGRIKDEDTRSEYLHTIVQECERLSRLVDGVLLFSKTEQGKKVFHLRPMNPAEAVNAAVRALDYPLSRQGFELELAMDPDLPVVRADRDALQQAVLNLLSNAMKYSGESRRLEVTVRHEGADVVIRVRDFGIGIAPEEQPRIFEKFYRAPTPENQRVAGTGLGLALVAQIMAAHGGTVEVESEPGKGSCFLLRLPVEKTT